MEGTAPVVSEEEKAVDRQKRQKEAYSRAWKEFNMRNPAYQKPGFRGRGGGGFKPFYQRDPLKHVYDPEKTKRYNDYLDFRKAIADSEEAFLSRLPKVDPNEFVRES